MVRLVYFYHQSLLTWLKHLGSFSMVMSWQIICKKYTQMKVVVWTLFTFWGCMRTQRSLWTPQRRQKFLWVGSARSPFWNFSEKYFWRLIHWRGNGIRKGYLWRRVQVCSLWGKEGVWHHIFRRPGIYWGVIGEWSGREGLRNNWIFMRNDKYSNNWMRMIYSLTLCPHDMKFFRLTHKIYSTDAGRTKKFLNRSWYRLTRSPYRLTHFIDTYVLLMISNYPELQKNKFFVALDSSISPTTYQC